MKDNGFKLEKERSKRYPAQTVMDVAYAFASGKYTHSSQNPAAWSKSSSCWHRPPCQCRQRGNISSLNGSSLKLVNKSTYLGSSISSTKTDVNTRLAKAWTAINRLLVLSKSDLTNKIKHSFFQAVVVLILLFGCTPWMLTKHMEKKLDGNYTRTLQAILNKSWRQHPTKQQLYGHLPPILKTIKVETNQTCRILQEK